MGDYLSDLNLGSDFVIRADLVSKVLGTVISLLVLWLVRKLVLGMAFKRLGEDATAVYRWRKSTAYAGWGIAFFLVGVIWISIHAGLLILVARLLKAPLFFMAVGSQANVGGAASAPIVAAAFHPALAPIGMLLAVLGYAVGTYGAWICGLILQAIGN